jgi:DNA polymerase-3 subunit gamma/tau
MKEKYQIIARKYRPQTFNEIIGQNAIVTTLKNAIRLNKTAYAYLFSGSRGIGKTSLARIFSKALNCPNLTDDYEPCCKCNSCLEIASSRSLDVIEIDGASNRGIDDIRHINETIGYAPSSGKYKIYIIDEVHMLTKEAFNALLKTLEEPPPIIKFFFATTEPHKVLPTILSRCQRFDLTTISHDLIIQKMISISKDLNRQIDKEALYLIARFSEGSLRDAESLLDKILCYEEGPITASIIEKTLSCLPKEHFFLLDKAVNNQEVSFIFQFVDKLFQMGKDFSYFLEELIEHFRYLLIVITEKSTKRLVFLSDEMKQRYSDSASLYKQEQLFYILDILMKSIPHMQKSPCKSITLEMILLQIIKSKNHISLNNLINRLLSLESSLKEKNIATTQPEKKSINSITNEKEEKKEKISISPAPLDINKKTEEKPPINAPIVDKKTQNHYDTLMRFAAVELEGTIKNTSKE